MRIAHQRGGLTLFIALAMSLVAPKASFGQVTQEQFTRLFNELEPDSNEAWRTIPWMTSLLDAQRVAAESNKPLFIWAMDGHPLGCT